MSTFWLPIALVRATPPKSLKKIVLPNMVDMVGQATDVGNEVSALR